jgi:hypothetical protein
MWPLATFRLHAWNATAILMKKIMVLCECSRYNARTVIYINVRHEREGVKNKIFCFVVPPFKAHAHIITCDRKLALKHLPDCNI